MLLRVCVVRVSVIQTDSLSVCLFVFLSVCLSVRPSVCLSVRLSVCLYVRPSVCLSVCLTTSLSPVFYFWQSPDVLSLCVREQRELWVALSHYDKMEIVWL